jgi:hypothetical protein
MQIRSLLGVAATAVAVTVLFSAPALAARAHHRPHTASADSYINPFTDPGWQPSRIDMGVDWAPTKPEPVLAIGNALILGSDWHAPWPGGRIIWYQLLDGSHAGDIIYVAENLRHLVPAGTHVEAGQKIADALPSYPWTEWGWADQYGTPIAFPCYHEGKQTRAGKRMARFLQALGATTADNPGSGPDTPLGGPLC